MVSGSVRRAGRHCLRRLDLRSEKPSRRSSGTLVGSTALGEDHEREVLRPVVVRCFDEMRTSIERHDERAEEVRSGRDRRRLRAADGSRRRQAQSRLRRMSLPPSQ
jgi:hypothetical protein